MYNNTYQKLLALILVCVALFLPKTVVFGATSDISDDFEDYNIADIDSQGDWTALATSTWFVVDNGAGGQELWRDVEVSADDKQVWKRVEYGDTGEGWLSWNFKITEDVSSNSQFYARFESNPSLEATSTLGATNFIMLYHYTDGSGGVKFSMPNTTEGALVEITDYDYSIGDWISIDLKFDNLRHDDPIYDTLIDVAVYIDNIYKGTWTVFSNSTLYYLTQVRWVVSTLSNIYIDDIEYEEQNPAFGFQGEDWEEDFYQYGDMTTCLARGLCWITSVSTPYNLLLTFINYDEVGWCGECLPEYCNGTSTPYGECGACDTSGTCATASTTCQWHSASGTCVPIYYGMCKADNPKGLCQNCNNSTDCASGGCYWDTINSLCLIASSTAVMEADLFPQWARDWIGYVAVYIQNMIDTFTDFFQSRFPISWVVGINNSINEAKTRDMPDSYPSLNITVDLGTGASSTVNMFPMEEITTSGSLLGSGTSFVGFFNTVRALLTAVVYISFAFVVFNRTKKLITQLSTMES